MTISGVYCIQNKINGKVYIGSTSRDFETRFKEHKRLLLENRHHCSYLQRAWNKYGEMESELIPRAYLHTLSPFSFEY